MKDHEALVQAIHELTNQTARQAYASELLLMTSLTSESNFGTPCPCCGCRLVPANVKQCPACRTERP